MASTFFKDGGVEKGVKGHEFGGCLLALAGCVIPKNHLHCLAVRGEFIQRRHIILVTRDPAASRYRRSHHTSQRRWRRRHAKSSPHQT
jgi:hypothetical protein